LGTGPKVIVEVLPQPLLLTAVVPPELPLDPELELPIAPESPSEVDPLLEPEPVEMPELDVEPRPVVPELEPPPVLELPELDALPEEEEEEEDAAASLLGERSLVELLPHALAIAARHARHPISGEWRRTLLVTLSVSICPVVMSRYGRLRGPPCSGIGGSNPSLRAGRNCTALVRGRHGLAKT
jgi:hypothetical protein